MWDMKRLFFPVLALTTIGLVGCASDNTDDDGSGEQSEQSVTAAATADNCLGTQDLDAPDVDISACPPIPSLPENARLGAGGPSLSLGNWELGTTASGQVYKYGSLSRPGTSPRKLSYDSGSDEVNDGNLQCWAKGYYRLRKYLKDPPREYVALRKAGFQGRFFQFQTDLRNGPTGFRRISSYMDHLVKWVTVVQADGSCDQPTLSEFRDYAKSELQRRGLAAD